ncbi:MAG: MBL fold metallo-hydrolase [Candidatus Bathyarchaeia archaeon]
MTTKVDEATFLIDTEAFGQKARVAAFAIASDSPVLIDTGYASSAGTVLTKIKSLGLNMADFTRIIPTHVHLDHAGATGVLVREMSNAQVFVHERGVKHLVDPTRLVASARTVFAKEEFSQFGTVMPIEANRVTSVADHQVLDLGQGLKLEMIWAPGHAPHELCILNKRTGALFTGDAVCTYYPYFKALTPTAPPPSFDLRQTVESLRQLKALKPRLLLTPHFGAIEHAEEMLQRNIQRFSEWESLILEGHAEGQSSDKILNSLLWHVAKEAGCSLDEVPGHVRTTTKMALIGYESYLQKAGFIDSPRREN